jgi:hypothetical protein
MSRKEPQETNSGVKKKGNWQDIAEFAREVEDAVKDSDLEDEEVEEYNDWRPREEETEEEIKERTAEKAAIKVSRENVSVINEAEKAGKKFAEAGEKATKLESPKNDVFDGIKQFSSGIILKMASVAQGFEKSVYRRFMLRFNPYFYDTTNLSVDMRSKRNGEYQMDVSVTEDEARKNLKKRFKED